MVFKCNVCGSKKGVVSGFCPKDGPVQTTPLDYDAKVASEAIEVKASGPAVEEAEIVEDDEE